MNRIFRKVLSNAEEFANRSSRLNLAADSILDRIIPKAIAHAGCWKYRTITVVGCGGCGSSQMQGKIKAYQKRFCDTPPGHSCSDPNVHCDAWQTIQEWCEACYI